MEQVPPDSAHDRNIRLTDIARYCRLCTEAEGDLLQTRFAVADFISRQFHLDYTDAGQLLDHFGLFDENDSRQVMYNKASLAPLFVMEAYIDLTAGLELSDDHRLWSDQLADWYSDMATMARDMALGAGYDVANCRVGAAESLCEAQAHCPLHALRRFLLAPVLCDDLSVLVTEADRTRHLVIVDAKLSAAVDCELLTEVQKGELGSEYRARIAQQVIGDE